MSRRRGRPWGVLAPLTVTALAVSACAPARDSSENSSSPSIGAPVVATTTDVPPASSETDASNTAVPASSTVPPSGPSSGPSTTTTRPKPTTTTTTTPPLQEVDWGVFDISLTDQIVNGGSRAASVAVALDGRIVHRGAYGQRVPGEALAPSDRFRVASISKPILSATVLRLVDEGELSLDKPVLEMVAQHLGVPLTDPRAARVTVRQLLAHTSGFGEFENELFYAGSTSCPHAASIAFAESLDARPGKDYLYSNMNFCLLGLVVEAAQDTPFQRVVQREVLRPVGVTDMRTAGTRDVRANDVLHDVAPGRTFMETLGAAGTWIATPSDIVKFGDSLDPAKPGAHTVSRRTLTTMRKPSSPRPPGTPRRDFWYGLGLMVWRDGSFGHTGTLENTHAMFLVRPDGVTWAVLVSGENPWSSLELRGMVDEALLAALR